MDHLAVILLLAAFIEVVLEAIKPALDPLLGEVQKVNPYLYLSLLAGEGLAWLYQANVLEALGLASPHPVAHYVGVFATGLVLGRGANFVHDSLKYMAQAASPRTAAGQDRPMDEE